MIEETSLLSLLVLRVALAAVFLVAGVAKLAARAGAERAITDFGIPGAVAPLLGLALPLVEISVVILLLAARTAWWAAVLALTLLVGFILAIGLNLTRGRRTQCHCSGNYTRLQ
jgi:uncharacterized membrane protein YphA (DoxX/SURF4 family)